MYIIFSIFFGLGIAYMVLDDKISKILIINNI